MLTSVNETPNQGYQNSQSDERETSRGANEESASNKKLESHNNASKKI